jgi:hypothetical protein
LSIDFNDLRGQFRINHGTRNLMGAEPALISQRKSAYLSEKHRKIHFRNFPQKRAGRLYGKQPAGLRYAARRKIMRVEMNYTVNNVARSDGGYGFHITDSRGKLLVFFEFEQEDKAKDAQRLIGQIIPIATQIIPR